MTSNLPALIAGPTLADADPTRATAVLRFPGRELSWVGEAADGWHGGDVSALSEADLGAQRNFAGISFAQAWEASGPMARHILDRITEVFRRSYGASFAVDRVLVTVRIDRRVAYSQSQGAHVDWARLKEFHPREWGEVAGQSAQADGSSFRSLANCHSIDCVLGGPPTEYFLAEQDGTVLLSRRDCDQPWIVTGVDFPTCGAPQSGVTGTLLYRPPFTIHQFPSPGSWRSDNPVRLFVSCDYWTI
jgi:hypothetical protein